MRRCAWIGIWLLLLPLTAWGQQPPKRRSHRPAAPQTAVPAPVPSGPPLPAAPPARLVVQGPIADLLFDPNLVFVIFTRPQLGCMIELPEKARTCSVTNPDYFAAEVVPVGKRKATDPTDLERDRSLLAVKMTSPHLTVDGIPLETTLSVILDSGRRLTCLVRPAADEAQHVYEIRFRDPELERQRERLEAQKREQATEARTSQTLLAADRARAENRAAQLLATGLPASLAVSSRGEVTARLFVEVNPSFLVALVTVKPSGTKLTPLTPVDWTLDGRLVTEAVRLQPLPPALLAEAVTEAVLLPYANHQLPSLVQCGFLVGRKAVKLDFPLASATILTAAPSLPVKPGRNEVALPPSRHANLPTVMVPVVNREPVPEPPPTAQPVVTPPVMAAPAEAGDAWKRLTLLAETTYDRHNGAAEALTKQVRLRLYTERQGDVLLATLRLERRLSGTPIRIGTLRWTAGGKPVTPSRTTGGLPETLEIQPVAAGFLFGAAELGGSLSCTLDLNGKNETIVRPLETVAVTTAPPPVPATTAPALVQPQPEPVLPRKLQPGAASSTAVLVASRIPIPGIAFRREDILSGGDPVPLPPQPELPLAKSTPVAVTVAGLPPAVTAAGVSLVVPASVPAPPTPVEKTEPPKTYSISKPQPVVKPATSSTSVIDRAEKQKQDRLRAQLKQTLNATVAAPLLKIREGNVVLKVLSTTAWEGYTLYLFEMVCTDAQVQNLAASYTATNDRIPGFAADLTRPVEVLLVQQNHLEVGDVIRFGVAVEGLRQKQIELAWRTNLTPFSIRIQP
ncbi:MAG: hypothetical protein K1Y36_18650 [Blastocatellia bacterium]|nr:hypothetical protein [Blastocatellia bacterium]